MQAVHASSLSTDNAREFASLRISGTRQRVTVHFDNCQSRFRPRRQPSANLGCLVDTDVGGRVPRVQDIVIRDVRHEVSAVFQRPAGRAGGSARHHRRSGASGDVAERAGHRLPVERNAARVGGGQQRRVGDVDEVLGAEDLGRCAEGTHEASPFGRFGQTEVIAAAAAEKLLVCSHVTCALHFHYLVHSLIYFGQL